MKSIARLLNKEGFCFGFKKQKALRPEESPDDLDKNHQVKVDAHLVM
ncbi:hypothetical protein IFVP182_C2120001 [Vibrio parahaemolyticus]